MTTLDTKRVMMMDGIRNFRDIGGYPVTGNKRVAWGKLYRAANLYEASDRDLDKIIHHLGIRHVVDFRNISETEKEPEPKVIREQTTYHWIPVHVEGTARDELVEKLKAADPDTDFKKLLQDVNQKLVTDHAVEIRQWFDVLLEGEPPLLFHCTEGKDRTGYAAALTLHVLGVEQKLIMQDYLLTNTVNEHLIDERINMARVLSLFRYEESHLRDLLSARKAYLQTAFETMEKHYGSVDAYLEQAVGLDAFQQQKLRNKFLEPMKSSGN